VRVSWPLACTNHGQPSSPSRPCADYRVAMQPRPTLIRDGGMCRIDECMTAGFPGHFMRHRFAHHALCFGRVSFAHHALWSLLRSEVRTSSGVNPEDHSVSSSASAFPEQRLPLILIFTDSASVASDARVSASRSQYQRHKLGKPRAQCLGYLIGAGLMFISQVVKF
jgi:hypothetical protein